LIFLIERFNVLLRTQNQCSKLGVKSYVPAWKTILSGKPPLDFAEEKQTALISFSAFDFDFSKWSWL